MLNDFTVTFTPDQDYQVNSYTYLSNYDEKTFTHSVLFKQYEGNVLYVSNEGKSENNGTKESPLDVYTAVKYVQPGQTIYIMEGTYKLSSTIKVERGINGTADKMIYMIADPDASTRPVFDFGGKCAGMVLAGDYWYFKGFDVTNSANTQKGIQVSGSNNTLDQINTYKNGNTGIQIARYLTTDSGKNDGWPANNLILNCTSYLNADAGYEDADGFAAKLTIGEGNVFDGCISAYNADDGWDCFTKAETGAIGKVTIQNCIAYKNGYVLLNDDGELDINGKEVSAGNGNGFKMGGESITGHHELRNSLAFYNKAKGIDSNSCPDIQAYNSVTFNNESYNVAFYTNNAKNTDFKASGVISFRTENLTVAEQLKPVGTQDTTQYLNAYNFFWDTATKTSHNTENVTVSESWFKSLDFSLVDRNFDRNEDGSINVHGFLELTDEAREAMKATGNDSSVGLGGTSSKDDATIDFSKEVEGSQGVVGDNVGDNNNSGSNDSSNTSSDNNSNTSESSSTTETVVTAPTYEIPPMLTEATVSANATISGEVTANNTTVNINDTLSLNLTKSKGIINVGAIQQFYGNYDYIAAHLGNGVGITINNASFKGEASVNTEINIGANVVEMPNFAQGFDTIRVIPTKADKLPCDIYIHINVGIENVGKKAYIFTLNTEENKYELKGIFDVNNIGNVAITTNEMTDIMILVQD